MVDEATRLIHEAIDCSDGGNYEAAVRVLTRAMNADPSNPQAYFEQAMALANLNRNDEEVTELNRALELDPLFPGAREWLARALASLGEHRRAADEWLHYLRDNPDGPPGMGVSPQCWADWAEEFAKAGDSAPASGLLEEYLARRSGPERLEHPCVPT
jgi:tetratricopeptide (TPR) repeat protein